jgi:hypothetical protein
MKECQLSDIEEGGSIALNPSPCDGSTGNAGSPSDANLEALVKSVTDAVMEAFSAK